MYCYLKQTLCRTSIFKYVINHVISKCFSPFDTSASWIIKEIFHDVCCGAMYDLSFFVRRELCIRYNTLKIIFQILIVFLLVFFCNKKPADILSQQHFSFTTLKDSVSSTIQDISAICTGFYKQVKITANFRISFQTTQINR